MQFFKNTKIQKIMLVAFVIVSCVYAVLPVNVLTVKAADFKHNHTGACYKQETGPCNAQHKTSTRTTTKTAHCSNCLVQTSQTVYVHWDHCYGNGQDYELGGYHICNTCGSQTYSWGGSTAETHMVSKQVISCGQDNETTGSLWLKNTTTDWTSGEVILGAGVTIYNNSLSLASAPYSWDDKVSWTTETSKQVTENGIYTVYAKSADGRILGETANVTNIDRTGPTLSKVEKSVTEWTNQDVVLTFYAEDIQPEGGMGCGLAEKTYSFDGGETYREENCLTVSGNGTYDVMLMDQLGNVRKEQTEVDNIDKNEPIINGISSLSEEWQAESIMMQVQAEDAAEGSGLHVSGFSLDGETWQETNEFLFTENGQYRIFVRDMVGNIAVEDFYVKQIDKTAPVIAHLEVDPDQIEKNKVYVTIHARDIQPDGSAGSGLHSEAYSLDGGETWQAENVFCVEEGEVYDVRVRDNLLWESTEYMIERKDFPYPLFKMNEQDSTEKSFDNSDSESVGQIEQEVLEEARDEIFIEEKEMEQHNLVALEIEAEFDDRHLGEEETAFETEDNKKPDIDDTKQSVVKGLTENAIAIEQPVKQIRLPWYTTTVGKAVIVSAATLGIGSVIGVICYLYLFSISVYCIEKDDTLKKLGRVLLHRTRNGYTVYLSEFMFRTAVVPKYRMKVSKVILRRLENARLLVESEEKNLEVLIQETIDFEL